MAALLGAGIAMAGAAAGNGAAATAPAAASAAGEDVVALLGDFPRHWNQYDALYNAFTVEEYGRPAYCGCVAVAGAAVMDWFDWPEAFGEKYFGGDGRWLRAETVAWPQLREAPLNARGRRAAQTVLYNLGLLTQMRYAFGGGSSTTVLANLSSALLDPAVGYASAYYVELGAGATAADFDAAIHASLRCGSPVAMSVGQNSAHAIVACGNKIVDGQSQTLTFAGYGGRPAWSTLPNAAGYSRVESVVTGIVPRRPAGIASGYAVPILGTVTDAAGAPVPLAPVSLRNAAGETVGETSTDLQGRFGVWGWFGHALTVSCLGAERTLPARAFPGYMDNRGIARVSLDALAEAVAANTVALAVAEAAPEILGTWAEAQAAARAAGLPVLCLRATSPADKAAFRAATGVVRWFADPALDFENGDAAPLPALAAHPEASHALLDAEGNLLAFNLGRPLADFLADRASPAPREIAGDATLSPADNGRDVIVAAPATLAVSGEVRLGTLTVAAPLTLTGPGSCTWQTLDQRAALTLDGPNLCYRPPWLGAGQSAFPLALTVRGGAELFLCEGQVTGFGLDASAARAITIGPGGILTATRRDLFARRLILDGGRIDLGDPTEKMAPLDLKAGATLEVRGEASIGSLSGVDKAFVNIGGNTIAFADGARLSCAVPLRGTGTLTLAGPGTLALADGTEVRAPTLVGQGVRLEGGTFADKTLSLTGGARLTPDRPITVAGSFSSAGTITVEGARSGILIRGGAKTAVSFATPEGFEARRVGDDWRLVAKYATAPLPYVGGAEADAFPATPERNLLVLTTTDRKESGLWEDYARFRSSAEGGGWNVLIAALGNLADGQTAADYIAASGCDYVLLGLSPAELPPLDGSADRLPGHHVGRLPLRETLALGTVVDLSSEGGSATQEYTTYSDADLLAAYVAKLRRAGPRHAPGALTLQGTAYDDNRTYTNAIDYGALWPALAGWTLGNKRATSLYALFDRYAALKTLAPNAFDNLFLACDGAYRTDGTPSGRADLATQDATLLWAEGADGRDTLGLLQARGGKNRLTAEAIPGLATLILAPIGQSGDLAARTPDTPCVGELLVLNPAGGALAAILPTHASDTAITDAGLPSGPTHTACANLAAELLRTPAPTIGEALTRATGTAGLTLLGDPTTRPTPRPPLGYRLLLR